MEAYQYKPLGQGPNFRYLILEPGQGDDPLVCSLHESRVENATFEAISYVWGSIYRDRDIMCNDSRMRITANLQEALRQLRLPQKPRNLWADSICINQDDPGERGHQVNIMGQIYAQAKRVLICFGQDSTGDAKQVMTLADDVNRMVLSILEKLNYAPHSFPHAEESDPLRLDSRWPSVATMIKASWFQRGWVVQEAGLGKSIAILWGQTQIGGWEAFMRTWRWADQFNARRARHDPMAPLFGRIVSGLPNIHDEVFTAKHPKETMAWYARASDGITTSHLEIMRWSHGLSFADQRDQVYAFLSLGQQLTPSNFRPQVPDYTLSLYQVYTEFARKYLLDTADLSLLNYAQHDVHSISEEIPSWCPRWDLRIYLDHFSAPRRQSIRSVTKPTLSVHILQENVLRVSGIIIDSIETTSEVFTGRPTAEQLGSLWANWRSLWRPSSPYTSTFAFQAFLTCLFVSFWRDNTEHWYQAFVTLLSQILMFSQDTVTPDILRSPESALAGDTTSLRFIIRLETRSRKAVITERGYYGLTPGITQVGDVIAVIFGAQSPLVLRKQPNEIGNTRYKLVGEAFVSSKDYGAVHLSGENMTSAQLGEGSSRDWEDWNLQEEEIFLV